MSAIGVIDYVTASIVSCSTLRSRLAQIEEALSSCAEEGRAHEVRNLRALEKVTCAELAQRSCLYEVCSACRRCPRVQPMAVTKVSDEALQGTL